MMKSNIIGVIMIIVMIGIGTNVELYAQDTVATSHEAKIQEFQKELNKHYADSAETPLLLKDWSSFKALEFFDIDAKFNVTGEFTRIESEPFGMQTSTARKPTYEKWGEAHFELDGKACTLSLFQSHSSREDSVWKHYLFLPYKDLTSGNESYGGGKFIDVLMPKDGKVHIDFNEGYNPYCAYNHKYSCPIPPEENYLDVEIRAGVKAWEEH